MCTCQWDPYLGRYKEFWKASKPRERRRVDVPALVAAEDDRYGLRTETTGVVYFHADVVVGSAFAECNARLG